MHSEKDHDWEGEDVRADWERLVATRGNDAPDDEGWPDVTWWAIGLLIAGLVLVGLATHHHGGL